MNSYIETLKDIQSLSVPELNRISTAINWYWCRMSLEVVLSEEDENTIMSVANKMWFDYSNANEMWIMDEIVNRINEHANNPHEYVQHLKDSEDERDSVDIGARENHEC